MAVMLNSMDPLPFTAANSGWNTININSLGGDSITDAAMALISVAAPANLIYNLRGTGMTAPASMGQLTASHYFHAVPVVSNQFDFFRQNTTVQYSMHFHGHLTTYDAAVLPQYVTLSLANESAWETVDLSTYSLAPGAYGVVLDVRQNPAGSTVLARAYGSSYDVGSAAAGQTTPKAETLLTRISGGKVDIFRSSSSALVDVIAYITGGIIWPAAPVAITEGSYPNFASLDISSSSMIVHGALVRSTYEGGVHLIASKRAGGSWDIRSLAGPNYANRTMIIPASPDEGIEITGQSANMKIYGYVADSVTISVNTLVSNSGTCYQAFRLGPNSATAMTLLPTYDATVGAVRIADSERTQSGLSFRYLGQYDKMDLPLEYIPQGSADIVNSWYNTRYPLQLFINSIYSVSSTVSVVTGYTTVSGTTTVTSTVGTSLYTSVSGVYSVMIINDSTPFSTPVWPYDNVYNGTIELEGY